MDQAAAAPPGPARRRGLLVAGGLAAVAVAASAGLVWGLSDADPGEASPAGTGSLEQDVDLAESSAQDSAGDPADDDLSADGNPPADESDTDSSGGATDGGDAADGSDAGQPDGPVIELFDVTQQPRCPAGTDLNPIEGQPLILSWRVTGAEELTLSIDGPGVYATLDDHDSSDANDGVKTFSFGCSGDEGDAARHTYVLTATSDGQIVTSELVVEAVVHERASVDPEQ